MKKGAAIGLLAVGSAAVLAGISIANLHLFFELFAVGLILAILVTAGVTFGITRLRGVFDRHYGISAPRFLLIALVPSVAVSGVFFIVVLVLDNMRYFKGFMGGLLVGLYGLTWLITSGAAVIMGDVMLAISCNRQKG